MGAGASTSLENVSDRRVREKFMIKAFNRRKEGQTLEQQLSDAFAKIDSDGNGTIDEEEMKHVLAELGWDLDADQRRNVRNLRSSHSYTYVLISLVFL
jgi:Ca2+-binding EF-hand superfamily protein